MANAGAIAAPMCTFRVSMALAVRTRVDIWNRACRSALCLPIARTRRASFGSLRFAITCVYIYEKWARWR